MTRWLGKRRTIALLVATLTGILLPGCGGVLDPAGPVGHAQRTIAFNALAIMLAIVIPTIAATLAFAWWFRASNRRAHYDPNFVYSGRIELIVWSIPTLVIIFLGGVIWIGSHQLDPAEPLSSPAQPIDVQVVSLDWKWLFIYPRENIGAVNRLVVPVDTPIRFALTSGSVWNAFFVPRLGSMIYAMNGMTTRLNLQADRPGTFEGLSTMFSGDGFPGMRFQVQAVSGKEFTAWVEATRAAGPRLDRTGYRELAQQSTNVPATTFAAVEPGLFQAIADGSLPASSGPRSLKRDDAKANGG